MTEISVASESTRLDAQCESLSYAVVEAVADAEGADPLDLEPLYETVDPDALDALFSCGDETTAGKVTFTYQGYDVSVDSEGSVSLENSTNRFRIDTR